MVDAKTIESRHWSPSWFAKNISAATTTIVVAATTAMPPPWGVGTLCEERAFGLASA